MATTTKQKDELLSFGFIREYQLNQQLSISHRIPNEIIFIIIAFYAIRYEVYCIGNQNSNSFALNHETEEESRRRLQQYTLSPNISKHCTDPDSISTYRSVIIIQNYNNNNIYVTGKNIFDTTKEFNIIENLGQKLADTQTDDGVVDIFKKDNDYINIISKGIWSNSCFMISKNNKIYPFNANYFGKLESNKNIQFFSDNQLKIIGVSSGGEYALFICADGSVYGIGDSSRGQCGVSAEKVYQPTKITFDVDGVKIRDISSGSSHNLCVTEDDNLYTFGWNSYGQLGIGKNAGHAAGDDCVVEPVFNEYFKDINVVKVQCGAWHSAVIDDKGWCYLFGFNSNGQIGQNDVDRYKWMPWKFKFKGLDVRIKNMGCGYRHTLLLGIDEFIYVFGQNDQKQCHPMRRGSIRTPCKLGKAEIGIDEKKRIERVICGPYSSMIVTSV